MTPVFSYYFQASVVTAAFLLFYKLLLRKDTFFKWSRGYFITAILCSFALPLIDASLLLQKSASRDLIAYIPNLSFTNLQVQQQTNYWQEFLISLLYAGIGIMFIRLLMQMAALKKLRRNKTISHKEKIKIVLLDEQVNPFSFFNEIYLNPHLHSDAELDEIIKHEQFHIEQHHTLDILLGELLTIVFWFNPFAWLLKNEMKQNLEFLTDKLVLQTGIDAKHYQYNLLKVSGLQNNIAAANHFHFLKLKNRIMMMNKKQTNPFHAIKFLLLVPIVAILLMAFSERKQILQTFTAAIHRDTLPPPAPVVPPTPPSPPDAVDKVTVTSSVSPAGEKQLPENVKQVDVINKDGVNKVTITLKDGTKEEYDLSNAEDKKRFEKKYGKIAETVPAPPGGRVTITTKKQPAKNGKGYYLTIADNEGECVVIVKDKNQKIVEAVKLTDWDAAKSKYENKYGPLTIKEEVKTVSITTNAGNDGPDNPYSASNGKITFSTTQQTFNGLVIVDGVEQPNMTSLNSIDPNTIESVNVLKDESAVKIYGEKGKNGVIIVKTKKNDKSSGSTITIGSGSSIANSPTITVTKTENSSSPKNGIIINGKTVTSTSPTPVKSGLHLFGDASELLIIVEGKEVSHDDLDTKYKPEQIKSISVLKGEKAIVKYGDKGKNGVIEIELK
jgi:TonB-dependent SusC/RagA subfamily outer membrane receptor